MQERGWIFVVGGFLALLLWFMLEPEKFLPLPPPSAHPHVESTAAETFSVSTNHPKAVQDANRETSMGIDPSLETGSGKEVPGEKLIQFSSPEAYRRFLALAPPGAVLGKLDPLNSIQVKTGSWLSSALAQTGGTVSGNFYVRVPEVPLEVRQKGDALYQVVGKKALDLIGAGNVADFWGKGVRIALMDTPVEGVDQVEGETAGHGTAMRSLILGQKGPARGAAPGAELVPFAVLDQNGKGNSFVLAQAILRATDQGFRVINMSLGSDGDSPVVQSAVAYALARNVVLVAAAGNDAVNRVSYPAAYEGVVAVASVDADGNHLYFSNRGKSVDVAAPGYAVVADWPGGKKVEVSGTSASTALVTGAIAALLSREPNLSGKQAVDLIAKYADATGLPGSEEETGAGVLNLQRVLDRNQRGIIDVAASGASMREEGGVGRITAGIQNRGTETVNSPTLEITAGPDTRKFYFGSLAPGQTAAESVTFDAMRARQEGRISVKILAKARGDQRPENDRYPKDFPSINFIIPKEK